MTLFSYEIFDAVARQGSFNKAAQQLHLTPSAISHAIAVMEAELGFTLFNRGKNGVTMTSYGASLYPSIRAVLNSDEALQQSIARLNGLEKGKVKLGAFNSVSTVCPTVCATSRYCFFSSSRFSSFASCCCVVNLQIIVQA